MLKFWYLWTRIRLKYIIKCDQLHKHICMYWRNISKQRVENWMLSWWDHTMKMTKYHILRSQSSLNSCNQKWLLASVRGNQKWFAASSKHFIVQLFSAAKKYRFRVQADPHHTNIFSWILRSRIFKNKSKCHH